MQNFCHQINLNQEIIKKSYIELTKACCKTIYNISLKLVVSSWKLLNRSTSRHIKIRINIKIKIPALVYANRKPMIVCDPCNCESSKKLN